jgi:long-subunit acyl-CoA synthetase (AMP-forming)
MGNSKGVMLSHGNLAANICDAARYVGLGSDDPEDERESWRAPLFV